MIEYFHASIKTQAILVETYSSKEEETHGAGYERSVEGNREEEKKCSCEGDGCG